MPELVTLLAVYYACAVDAAQGTLTQTQRFACNETYQQAKRHFAQDEALRQPGSYLPPEENTQAYLRLKAWEVENAELVAALKAR